MKNKIGNRQLAIGSVFTIIELLVVIGIIAILACILLPALKRAKETAGKIQCVGQLKQTLLIRNYYSEDYNGYLMPSSMVGNWYGVAGGYAYAGDIAQKLGYIPERTSGDEKYMELCCPTFPSGNKPYRHYAWFGNRIDLAQPNLYTNYNIKKYQDPSKEKMLCDSVEDGSKNIYQYFQVYANGNGSVWLAQVHRRHANLANWGYMDGHADSLNRSGCADMGYAKSWP